MYILKPIAWFEKTFLFLPLPRRYGRPLGLMVATSPEAVVAGAFKWHARFHGWCAKPASMAGLASEVPTLEQWNHHLQSACGKGFFLWRTHSSFLGNRWVGMWVGMIKLTYCRKGVSGEWRILLHCTMLPTPHFEVC